MSEMPNKKSLNNGVKEAGTEGEGFLPGRCLMGKQRRPGRHPVTAHRKWSKEDNKMAILRYLQGKKGPNIGYRMRMHQYWKDYELFELEEQHLACQVRSILKTGKLSKVEIEGLKRQIIKLHMEIVESITGELDAAEEEVVTLSDDNVLLQELTAGASGYVEDAGVIESESESGITKRLKLLLKNPKNDPIPSLWSVDTFQLKHETEEVNKAMSSIMLNDISDFKNLIKAGATIVCERMGIRKSVKSQQNHSKNDALRVILQN